MANKKIIISRSQAEDLVEKLSVVHLQLASAACEPGCNKDNKCNVCKAFSQLTEVIELIKKLFLKP